MALVDRIKGICLKPKDEWLAIEGESTTAGDLLKNYALPLAAIGAVASFIGMSLIGVSFLGVSVRTPIASGLIKAVLQLALALVAVYVIALIIDGLAPSFGAQKNKGQALKVAVYASTPSWLAGVIGIVPSVALDSLVGLGGLCYAIYLFHLGLLQLMKPPKEKAVGYTVVVIVCAVVLFFVMSAVVAAIGGAGAVATGAAGLR